ncbi:ribosomal protein S18-alanine N-acetyltransferase [Desulforudis sp. 1088]|jgi:ribosomal-protein-alanine N-acetyltransferase|uniref:ribosomal protein S18-alanine N-acetyltransferase n=1 Tax=unclassified Candidatus Desulforudis TaxID=2635950 RepID=UPI00348F3A18
MRVTFEPMRVEHLDAIEELEKKSFPTPWPRQTFEFEILYNDLAEYVVAVHEGKVIGYGGAWMVLDEAHVTNVAVHPDYRGMKIGKALMLELMRRAVARGARCMTLEVRPSNTVARQLYARLGFVEAGVRKGYYQDNDEDAIIMWKQGLTTP